MHLRALLQQGLEKEKNCYGEGYISAPSLRLLVNTEAVQNCLRSRGLIVKSDVVSTIVLKAPAVFAALTLMEREHLIASFIEKQFYDQLLPAREIDLPSFEIAGDAKRFLDIQNFFPPVFRKDRIINFSPKSTLPFVTRPEGPFDSGASGQVFKVKIRKGHVSDFSIDLCCAQKRIPKFDEESWDDLKREITVLRKRQHPGIISLLGCYLVDGDESSSYVRSLNLLFPWVNLNLKQWMNLDHCPINLDLVDLRAFMYNKIYSLAEALAYIHRDVDDQIASHHDLKPENILVSDDKFLICDFGLSHLWQVADGSGTQGRLGLGTLTYQPPEYWREDGECSPIRHGRAFDIWALGCVVLEMLTVLIHGWGRGILRQFEDRRRKSATRIAFKDMEGKLKIDQSFHNHMDAVREWISELRRCDSSPRMNHMLRIVDAMLQDDPKERLLLWEVQLDLLDAIHPDVSNQDRKEQGIRIIQAPPINEPLRSGPMHRAASRGDSMRIELLFGAGWLSFVRDNRGFYPEQLVPSTAYEDVKRELRIRRISATQSDGSEIQMPASLKSVTSPHEIADDTVRAEWNNKYRSWYRKMHPEGINAPLLRSSATRTRLHMAAIQADDRAMQNQPKIFEDLDVVDEYFKTPLHYASQFATGDMVSMMLLQPTLGKFLLEARDINGDTPLHCAAISGNEETVRSLLQNTYCSGALHMENDAARTPSQLADCRGHEKLAALLRAAEDGTS